MTMKKEVNSNMREMWNSLGVSVYFKNLSYEAEMKRENIGQVYSTIDQFMNENAVPVETMARSNSIFQYIDDSIQTILHGVSSEDENGTLSDIIGACVYSFLLSNTVQTLVEMRGIIVMQDGPHYMFSAFADDASYKTALKLLRDTPLAKNSDDDDELNLPPTIH